MDLFLAGVNLAACSMVFVGLAIDERSNYGEWTSLVYIAIGSGVGALACFVEVMK